MLQVCEQRVHVAQTHLFGMQVTLKVVTEPAGSDLQLKVASQPGKVPSGKPVPSNSTGDPTIFPPDTAVLSNSTNDPTILLSDKAVPKNSTPRPSPQADNVIKAVHASSASVANSNAAGTHPAALSAPMAEAAKPPVHPATPSAAAVHPCAACNSSNSHAPPDLVAEAARRSSTHDTAGAICSRHGQDSAFAALQQQVTALLGDKAQLQQQLADVLREAKELKIRATMPPLTYVSMLFYTTASC